MEVYEEPDSHAGLYNYAKALEDVEAGLLAGFFYKHFCLASNVIGSQSQGECSCCGLWTEGACRRVSARMQVCKEALETSCKLSREKCKAWHLQAPL